MTQFAPFENVVVLGAAGGIGGLFSRMLKGLTSLECFDLFDGPSYSAADACNPNSRLLSALRGADLVLLCLPDPVVREALSVVASHVRDKSLLIINRSVMSDEPDISQYEPSREALFINLLFAPDLGVSGRAVIVTPAADSELKQQFIHMLESWGASIFVMTGEEHDRLAATFQALVHASSISFALALARMSEKGWERKQPPPSMLARMLAARVLNGKPETYWSIQTDNPYASEARQNLLHALDDLDSSVRCNRKDKFQEFWQEALKGLGPDVHRLADDCAKIFRSLV